MIELGTFVDVDSEVYVLLNIAGPSVGSIAMAAVECAAVPSDPPREDICSKTADALQNSTLSQVPGCRVVETLDPRSPNFSEPHTGRLHNLRALHSMLAFAFFHRPSCGSCAQAFLKSQIFPDSSA